MERLEFELPFEIREANGDEPSEGRSLEGRIVPYGDVVTVNGEQESFARGVFGDTNPDDVVLLMHHDTTRPVGRMVEIRDEEDGAYGVFRLADTEAAREAMSLARDRIARGLSVGFISEQATKKGSVRTHTKARLIETSLVTFPAYANAQVVGVRQEEQMDEQVETPAPESESETPDLGAALTQLRDDTTTQLREIRSDIANMSISGGEKPELPMSLRAGLAKALKMVADAPAENRALADVIGTGTGNAEGLIHDEYAREVLGVLDPLRPLFNAAGSYPFPTSGYGITFPRITQHTQVAKRGAEKSPIPTRELTVASGSWDMEWFAGGVDVALELISQSDPSVLEVVVGDMLDQYAIATEEEFVADVEAAATAGGAALDTSDWGAFTASVIATSQAIKAATGRPGDRLALTTASWTELVGLLNPSVPASLPGAGPGFTDESVDAKGIAVFHSPDSTVDVQFNTKALRKSEKPPLTVTANNVALMGRDIGVLGATIALPLYPAGIIKYAA